MPGRPGAMHLPDHAHRFVPAHARHLEARVQARKTHEFALEEAQSIVATVLVADREEQLQTEADAEERTISTQMIEDRGGEGRPGAGERSHRPKAHRRRAAPRGSAEPTTFGSALITAAWPKRPKALLHAARDCPCHNRRSPGSGASVDQSSAGRPRSKRSRKAATNNRTAPRPARTKTAEASKNNGCGNNGPGSGHNKRVRITPPASDGPKGNAPDRLSSGLAWRLAEHQGREHRQKEGHHHRLPAQEGARPSSSGRHLRPPCPSMTSTQAGKREAHPAAASACRPGRPARPGDQAELRQLPWRQPVWQRVPDRPGVHTGLRVQALAPGSGGARQGSGCGQPARRWRLRVFGGIWPGKQSRENEPDNRSRHRQVQGDFVMLQVA